MKNPKLIEVVKETATYKLPTYLITNEGIVDGEGLELKVCKGNREDESVFRQEGVFTESLLQMCIEYLISVNKGDLASKETSVAITHLETGLLWLGKRAEDRKLRNVQKTYQK